MKLIDEIITLASNESASVSTLLRKCLVLAHMLRNDRLQVWAQSELDGYQGEPAEIPEYRKTVAHAKGLFLGPAGVYIDGQPIPAVALKEEHRHWAEEATLAQPIAAYEGVAADSKMVFEWPANLTVLYQKTFFQGQYALNRAWLEVPGSVLVGLIDTIKTRILRLALELKGELGEVHDDPTELTKERVDQTVINNIYGGTNVIASHDFAQVGSIEIRQGDWGALSDALSSRLGVTPAAVRELKASLDADAKGALQLGLGIRTANWLKELGKTSGKAALKLAAEAAQAEARRWIFGFLGLPV